MRPLARAAWILLGFVACLPTISLAQEESTAAVNELVTGDQYTIRVERSGASESYTGLLLLAHPDWIVLQQEEAGRHEGVPISQRPFFNRMFKNVDIGREEILVWLPREAATIVQRVKPHDQRPLVDVAELGTPFCFSSCDIDYVEAGELKKLHGALFQVEDADFTIKWETMVAEQKSLPLLGDIPLVGRAFQYPVFAAQYHEHKLMCEDVLAVRVKCEDSLPRVKTE